MSYSGFRRDAEVLFVSPSEPKLSVLLISTVLNGRVRYVFWVCWPPETQSQIFWERFKQNAVQSNQAWATKFSLCCLTILSLFFFDSLSFLLQLSSTLSLDNVSINTTLTYGHIKWLKLSDFNGLDIIINISYLFTKKNQNHQYFSRLLLFLLMVTSSFFVIVLGTIYCRLKLVIVSGSKWTIWICRLTFKLCDKPVTLSLWHPFVKLFAKLQSYLSKGQWLIEQEYSKGSDFGLWSDK